MTDGDQGCQSWGLILREGFFNFKLAGHKIGSFGGFDTPLLSPAGANAHVGRHTSTSASEDPSGGHPPSFAAAVH